MTAVKLTKQDQRLYERFQELTGLDVHLGQHLFTCTVSPPGYTTYESHSYRDTSLGLQEIFSQLGPCKDMEIVYKTSVEALDRDDLVLELVAQLNTPMANIPRKVCEHQEIKLLSLRLQTKSPNSS